MTRILVVDDEPGMRRAIAKALNRAGYDNELAGSVDEALEKLQASAFEFVLSDINMPGGSGLALVERISETYPDIGVVMVTGVDDTQVAERAIELGAYGYLIKPYADNELLIQIANASRRRELEMAARDRAEGLEQAVTERTIELEQAQKAVQLAHEETIMRLARAAEFRDDETAQHVQRMSRYSSLIGQELGWDGRRCEMIRLASIMHDVGKIGIPEQIVLKPGKVTPQEFELTKTHTEIGHRLLVTSQAEVLRLGASVAWTHHERIDGSGYPRGIEDDAIPVEGRIVAIADVFDAMTSRRAYRDARSVEEVAAHLKQERDRLFDGQLVDLLLRRMDAVNTIRKNFPDRDV